MPPPYSILYVDDDTDLLELGKSFLESTQEFIVGTSDSALTAQTLIREQRPDAIVSDYEMSDMDGIVFLKQVRAQYGDLPFIVFTGRGREEVVIEALNNGADFYLQKGSDAEAVYAELRHVVKRAIEMRQARLTLAEQEQRFHDLQNASDMIQSVDPQGRFLFTNKKWQDTLGYGEAELPELSLFDIIHEESREHCMATFPRVIAGEDVGIIDVTFRAKDGRKIYAEGFASCKIADGKPQYTRGIFKDVTDRRETEQALKESEEKFRTLVEHALDGILILDPGGLILFANQAAGKLVEEEDYQKVMGRQNVMAFIAPESKETVIRDFRKVAQGIDGFLAQYKIITVLHRVRWVESIGKAITFEGKQAILISLRDITDRMRSESTIKENEEKFRTIFESSPYPIAINSMPDQKFIAVNPSFVKASGYAEEEILGKNPVELGLLSITGAAKLVSRAVLAGKIENVPLALNVKDGHKVHVLFSTIPITIGGKSAALTVTVEVTQLKRVEEELMRKNEDLRAAYEELAATEEELRANYEELYKREQGLRESEEKYRLMTETTTDVIYMMDKNGIITHVGPQIARYGYTLEEVLSHSFTEFLESDDASRALADMETTITTGQSTVTQLKMRDRAGNIRWLEDNGAAVHDASGRVIGLSGILRDITERKEMELALKESEEKFRALVDNSLEGIFIVNFTGKLLFANPAAARIVDIDDTRSVVGSLNVMDLVALVSKPAVVKDLAQVARGIDAYLVHYNLITAKKREIWVECIGKKISFEGNTAMLVSMRDVTGRRKAEEVLRESESRLATLFRSSPVALTLVAAKDGTFVDVSDAFVENTGFTREEVIGKTATEIHLFADSGEYEQFSSALRSRGGVRGMEIRCLSKDRKVQTCRFTSSVILMNAIPHILSNVENINEQKEAEKALNTLVKSMVGTTGVDSLHTITENVATWLGADCVMVSEVSPDRKSLVARSMILDGNRVAAFSCSLPGTPCNAVTEQGFLFYGDNLGQLFPTAEAVAEFGFSAYIGTPLHDSAGGVVGVLSAFFRTAQKSIAGYREILDIMAVKAAAEIERSRIEQTLRESEEKFRTLVEHSLDGILIVDMTGRILFANQAMAAMVASDSDLGYDSHEGGRNVLDFIAPEARDAVVQDFRNVKEGLDRYPVQYPAFTTTGKRIWIEGIGRKILYRTVPAVLVSIRDITARKQMEETLLRTNKQLSLLSGITRHDVLNKIAIIQGHLALAQRQGATPDYPALIEKIAPLITIIRQQVEFTRVYQNLGTKEPEWQSEKKFLASASVPKSVRLKSDLGDLEIYSDMMLEKVFHNLVDNSLRHGERVTEIRLASHPDDSGLTITYEDNGIGIPANKKEKIFERGYGKNTGLGLFLAREILSITGMTIRETGEGEKGARFEIHVPENAYRNASK
ncbi:PAS domain S-box protein [Methanoregula formicica]|uniref:histidine kinase n=1 Tax=Methanoregula formicica (strain DSM 22288 / NBRC 105244 / SMSP) TaxID=593750 RepID=L0HES3_METFS|nr:PAS domain S-box protein [Methanoregula formicica]AGB01604.1 PAS domain S-box [Methanoregula formicica SMSP]